MADSEFPPGWAVWPALDGISNRSSWTEEEGNNDTVVGTTGPEPEDDGKMNVESGSGEEADDEASGLESEKSDIENTELFSTVMANIQLNLMPSFVSIVRSRIDRAHGSKSLHKIEPVTVDSPIFGEFHVAFPLKFGDGHRWILKIPANGTHHTFDAISSRALSCEALTLQMLRRETTIPVPEVFAFDNTCENDLQCPFILMEFISGKPLYDCWFDKASPNDVVEEHRTKTLRDLATAMAQLVKFSTIDGGSIEYDENGRPTTIGSSRHVKLLDEHTWRPSYRSTEAPDFVELGPHRQPTAYYTQSLYNRPNPDDMFSKGALKLLKTFLSWAPYVDDDGRGQFVLSHPNLDMRNIIVSEDGSLQGIIGWDGVGTVPHAIGNEAYPKWLTRDWNPAQYNWNDDMRRAIIPEVGWEDSPETLEFYRGVYHAFMRKQPQVRGHYDLTRNSHIFEKLYLAASNRSCTMPILDKVFAGIVEKLIEGAEANIGTPRELTDIQNHMEDDFTFEQISCAIFGGSLTSLEACLLNLGFPKLLEETEPWEMYDP